MIAASEPTQRPPDARLLVVNPGGLITHAPRAGLVGFMRPGDLVVANDAATLPASLVGEHVPTGEPIEVRLAGFNMRTYLRRSHFGMSGRRLPDHRSRSNRRPPASRSTGACWQKCARMALRSPRSRMLPESHPPAMPNWTADCRSTNRTEFRSQPLWKSSAHERAANALWQLGPPSYVHLKTQ